MRTVLACLCLVALLAAGCTSAPPASNATPATLPTAAANLSSGHTTAQMVAFVHDAAAYARASGREAALAAFMNRSGPFFQDDLYIYAYDFDGVTLAHPLQTQLVGKSRLDELDAGGTPFIRNLREAARNGTGFARFWYVNPAHGHAIEPKLGYAERVGDWWLGSGVYRAVNPDPVAGTVAFVEEAVRYAKANGTVLPLPANPASVGSSHWNLVDPNGVRMVREMSDAARDGGGFVTYITNHRLDRAGVWEKRVYVAMAGDDWFVGSGTYAE
jgi:signal transduction histidine kinase